MTEALVRTTGQTSMLPGAVIAGGLVFTSGLVSPAALASINAPVPADPVPGAEQIEATLLLLDSVLHDAGTSLERVVRIEAYVSDAAMVPEWNERFLQRWPSPGPARMTLVAGFTNKAIVFELQAIAAL